MRVIIKIHMRLSIELNRGSWRWLIAILLAAGLFFGGYFFSQTAGSLGPSEQTIDQKKNYYISFDDYYYEVPKQKAADDKIIPGGQFLYNFGVAIRADTLDSLYDDGAIAVQKLTPLNSDNQAFERYINETVKPSTESVFKGTTEIVFSDREGDKVRAAEVISKKDGAVIRRQYILNLPQSVAVVTKDDSEAFRDIGKSVAQASAKFSDYEKVKLLALAQSSMLSNRMFGDLYRLAHEDFRGATSIDALNRLADKSKDLFTMEANISGVNLTKNELTVSIIYIDKAKPTSNKAGVLQFWKSAGEWKLIALQLPNGVITGAPQEPAK